MPHQIESAVLWTLVAPRFEVVIGAPEELLFPTIAFAAWKCRATSVRDPCLKLAPVDTVTEQSLGDRMAIGEEPVRVKVERHSCMRTDERA
jgi:hypothetical protein